MESDFGISVYRYKKNIVIKLSGDFDESSALQLLGLMRNCLKETDQIIIQTDYIGSIEPLALNLFRYNIGSLVKHSTKFVFTGEKALSLVETWPADSRPEIKKKTERQYNYQNKNEANLFHIDQVLERQEQ